MLSHREIARALLIEAYALIEAGSVVSIEGFDQAFRRAVHKSRREMLSASKTSAAMYDLVFTPDKRGSES